MTNHLFDPERPPVPGFWQRMSLLDFVADQVFEQPSSIDANDSESPVEGLRLEQASRPLGDREAFTIYITQGEWAPSPDAPIIRRLVWQRGRDEQASQHGSILWPDIDD